MRSDYPPGLQSILESGTSTPATCTLVYRSFFISYVFGETVLSFFLLLLRENMQVRLVQGSSSQLKDLCVEHEFDRAHQAQQPFASGTWLCEQGNRLCPTRSHEFRFGPLCGPTRPQPICCFVSQFRPLITRSNACLGFGPGSITSTCVRIALRIDLLLMPAVHRRVPFCLTSKHTIS